MQLLKWGFYQPQALNPGKEAERGEAPLQAIEVLSLSSAASGFHVNFLERTSLLISLR